MSSMVYLFLQTAVKALSGLLAFFALVAAGALFLRKARVSALASSVVFGCNGSDGCACGGCIVHATYGLEGSTFHGGSVACGCTPCDDPPPPEDPEPQIPYFSPHVDVWFSQSAVIFEDEYRNEVGGEIIPRRSTATCLCVYAEAGSENAEFVLDSLNLDKLDLVDGEDALPSAMTLGPGGVYYAEFVCEGAEASDYEGDVFVDAYIENESGDFDELTDSMTVVEVGLEVEDRPPLNPVPNRHIYGLREKVFCRNSPSCVTVQWKSGNEEIDDDDGFFRCSWTNGGYMVSATFGDVQLDTPILVYAPTVECRSAMWRSELVGQSGIAGMVGMSLALYLQPSTVSFANVWIQEVPEYVAIPQSGYFTLFPGLLPLTHDVSAGAGVWRQPIMTSNGNYWCDDAAQMPRECPPLVENDPPSWSEGTVRWMIPVGWGDFSTLIGRMSPNPTYQVYHMREDGTLSISKYDHMVMRSVDGRVWLDGSRVNAWWSGWLQ